MMEIEFRTIEDNADNEGREIVANLVAFNEAQVGDENHKTFTVKAFSETSDLIGGIKGYTHFGWVFITHLWVCETQRKANLGSTLMKKAEDIGLKRKCKYAYVDTYSFQALDFYKKIGYEVFGQLDDFPEGHQRYFLKKSIY